MSVPGKSDPKTGALVDPRRHDAVIFDLDGVVTDTARAHAAAWAELFDDLLRRRDPREGEDHAPFTTDDYRTYIDGKPSCDGAADFLVSRGVTLPRGEPTDEPGTTTIRALGALEDEMFRRRIARDGVPVFASTVEVIRKLQAIGIGIAVATASRNCAEILDAAGLGDLFTVAVDAGVIEDLDMAGKPDPALLLEAARRLGCAPARAVVVEGTDAGVAAGRNGGFGLVVAVDRDGDGRAEQLYRNGADAVVTDPAELQVRTGDRRMSTLPDALAAFPALSAELGKRRPALVLDFASALSAGPDAAAVLVEGAAIELARLAAHGPVVVIGDDDAGDLESRVGLPDVWYAGRGGLDLHGPRGQRVVSDAATCDRGTGLDWVLDHVPDVADSMPLYIGGDVGAEDAFDVLADRGIGIVVHRGVEDRPSAARYNVADPAQVRLLLQRIADTRIGAPQGGPRYDAWTLFFEGYDPPSEKLREALCTVGNGYFATRGCAPEAGAGTHHYPGTYAAGIFNRREDEVAGRVITNESMVNLPNWLPVTFRIDDGDWFDIDKVEILDYCQYLDLRRAVLTRRFRIRDAADRTTSVVQRRFVAMHLSHVCGLETTVTAEDWTGRLEFRSELDSAIGNTLVERYCDLDSIHLEKIAATIVSDDSVLLSMQTNQSRIPVAVAARNTLWEDGVRLAADSRPVEREGRIGHDITVDLTVGGHATLEKMVTVFTGRDLAVSEPGEAAARRLARTGRFDEILEGHVLTWRLLWDRVAINLGSDANSVRIVRLHLLHLLQTISPNTTELDVGVPARGLHGEAYRGHIFWDELFVLPVLNLTLPSLSRAMLRYRYRRLPEARHAAFEAGRTGAMFPWQSGSDGREESQQMHLNPRSGRWNPDASWRQHHIGIAVAYNTWQYHQATGDLEFLAEYGAELLVEIARFFADLATYDRARDRYVIRGVIGPDEFHSGYPDAPYDGIDNNAYTNVMAVWVILRAFDALEALPTQIRDELTGSLGLTDSETARWEDVTRRLHVPFHDRVISQFEGYEALAELDWDLYRRKYGDIQRLDRILEAEGDDVNRYRASKQADVLMLFYLLSADELRELLERLGHRIDADTIPRTIDYYMARTSHGSTLSAVVHTWVLTRRNRDRAMEFFDSVLASDITDIQGGTTSEGIHLAAMAGSVDLLQRCFSGLETRGDRIVFSPQWPGEFGALEFAIFYRGHRLHIRISGREVEVAAAVGVLPPIAIECRGTVAWLHPGDTVRLE